MRQLQSLGMIGVYPNGGALGFTGGTQTHSIGWIGPEDPTIRPDLMRFVRRVPAPSESNLASLTTRAWELITGPAWVMPSSHWAFELSFGSPDWLPETLLEIGLSPEIEGAAPIEFASEEADAMGRLLRRLLENLRASDFTLAFPSRAVHALVHHHKQIWWTSSDERLIQSIDRLAETINGSEPS